MLLKNILITICLLALTYSPATSQQSQTDPIDGEKPRSTLTINQNNFDCFQSLHCLKRENPFKNSNLNEISLNNNRTERYIIEGTSKNETLHAVYNSYGELVKATVIQRNIALPKKITHALTTGEFEPWFIIGNELVIENFDKNRMQYKVILEHQGEVRVEYFDNNGQLLNRLS